MAVHTLTLLDQSLDPLLNGATSWEIADFVVAVSIVLAAMVALIRLQQMERDGSSEEALADPEEALADPEEALTDNNMEDDAA